MTSVPVSLVTSQSLPLQNAAMSRLLDLWLPRRPSLALLLLPLPPPPLHPVSWCARCSGGSAHDAHEVDRFDAKTGVFFGSLGARFRPELPRCAYIPGDGFLWCNRNKLEALQFGTQEHASLSTSNPTVSVFQSRNVQTVQEPTITMVRVFDCRPYSSHWHSCPYSDRSLYMLFLGLPC